MDAGGCSHCDPAVRDRGQRIATRSTALGGASAGRFAAGCRKGGRRCHKLSGKGKTVMDACRIPIRDFPDPKLDAPLASEPVEKTAVLAGGCFWCVEAVFKELRGVISVRSGYAGGTASTADYR